MTKEEAIEILSDMRAEYNIFSDDEEEATRYHALSWAIQALNERTGRWIKNEGRHGWHCSECMETNYYAYAWNSETGREEFQDHYCPNCGAKMEVEE